MNKQIKNRINSIKNGTMPSGYRKSKIGIVPCEWKDICFKDLFSSTSDYTDDLSTYPLYSLTIEDGIVKKSDRYERSHLVKKEDAYKIVRPNDFAYNPMNIRFGAVARHKEKNLISVSGYYDIFTTKDSRDLSFMDNFLVSEHMIQYYNQVSTGSLIEKQRVHFSQFIEFKLPLPQIEEREKIAEILTTCDKVIELKEKLIAKKLAQKKWLMQNLLTGKIRLKGFSGEWKSKCIGDLFSFGSSLSASRAQLGNKGICYLHYGDIHANTNYYIDMTKEVINFPRIDTDIISKDFLLRDGDVVFVDASEDYDGVSKYVVISNPCEIPVVSGLHTISLQNKSNELIKSYKRYCFQSNNIKKQLSFYANGVNVLGVNKTNFSKIIIKYPSNEEQTAIANIISTNDNEIELLQKDLYEWKNKKKALMQLLLTGKVMVI